MFSTENSKSPKVIIIYYITVVISIHTILADLNNLVEEFSWKVIDYDFGNATNRKYAIDNEIYIPGASIPTGIEVWGDKMFIAIPRIKNGVPSTLNYINTSSNLVIVKIL